MAFNEIEKKRCERAMEPFLRRRRPPAHLRPGLDIGMRVGGRIAGVGDRAIHVST
jgi:hypothetical protein